MRDATTEPVAGSSADAALGSAVDELAKAARVSSRPVVLIDGGSGSGKSTLGAALAGRLGAQLVHLENIYRGWDDLAGASTLLHDLVLAAPAPGWRGWDWERAEPTDWHPLDPALPLVVEGSGSLSRDNRALATLAIWIELDARERKRRALGRDGETYARHWDRWAAQEAEFRAREHPELLADFVLDARTGDLARRTP